ANAEAERFMRTLNKAIITAHTEQLNWKQQLYRFLRNYRATPHASTDKTPAELFFGRKMRIKLPEVFPTVVDCDLRCKDATAKRKIKEYADDRNNAKPATFQIGDDVLVRQRKRNKFSSYNNPIPYHIVAQKCSMITAENAKHKITRNSSHFKKITRRSTRGSTTNDDDGEDEDIPNSDIEEPGIQEQPQRRYPLRLNRGQPPNRFSVPQ
ncbi:Retrovirus-related Pol poly from transposon 297, partial [Paramuricea clavata]